MLTFIDVLHSYEPERGRLTTALVPYLQHTFSDYVAKEHGSSQYDNLINSRIQKVLSEEDITGNEDPDHLNALYNKNTLKIRFPRNLLKSTLNIISCKIRSTWINILRNYCSMR